MAEKTQLKRRKADYGERYMPRTGLSTHPSDIAYISTNIPCQWACPAHTNIPGYIQAIHQGDYAKAYAINRLTNLFPGILGRVCSRPCEDKCRHGESDLGEPVSICHLKRVAADHSEHDYHLAERIFEPSGMSVGIVGGGPAGLAAANSLAIFGHRVTIYEAMPKLGGMMLYGIPDFRVPPALVEDEIFTVIRKGVQVRLNVRLGRDVTLEELRARHDAVVLALGCYSENSLNIPGEDLANVYFGLDFMMQANQGNPLPVGNKVAVIGGGFTAMDCSRTALRLGARDVTNFIRRTETEILVTKDEILETKREGINIVGLVSPMEFIGDGAVEQVRFVRNRLVGSGHKSGKRPQAIEGSEFILDADTVIVAIGQKPGRDVVWLDQEKAPQFEASGACQLPGLYLAGDFMGGASTVIEAIGHAQEVAVHCDQYLMGRLRKQWVVSCEASTDTSRERNWDFLPKNHIPTLPVPQRLEDAAAEVETGYPLEIGNREASRCYLCDLRYTIHVPDCIYCRWCIERCPRNCIHLASEVQSAEAEGERISKAGGWNEVAGIVIASDRCIRCGECLRICPTQCIHVTKVEYVDRLTNQPGAASK